MNSAHLKFGLKLTIVLLLLLLNDIRIGEAYNSDYFSQEKPKLKSSHLTDHYKNSPFRANKSVGEIKYTFPADVRTIYWLGSADRSTRPYELFANWIDPNGKVYFKERCTWKGTESYRSQLKLPRKRKGIQTGQWRVEIRDRNNALVVHNRFYIGAPKNLSNINLNEIWSNPDYDINQANALVLLKEVKIIVDEKYRVTRNVYKKIKVLNEKGKRHAEVYEPYVDNHEIPSIGFAHTILPDGQIIRQSKQMFGTLRKAPPYYTSSKVIVMSMPSIADGVLMEYEMKFDGTQPFTAGMFYNEMRMSEELPVVEAKYSVTVPAGMELNYSNINHLYAPQVTQLKESGQKNYTWTVRNVPPIKIEPHMAPYRKVGWSVVVSSTKSWEPVGTWWRNLTAFKYTVSEEVENLLEELVPEDSTPQSTINKIYAYVKKDIRYVGYDFGRTIYEPAPADRILLNKSGDCKNQSILLKTLLNKAGIEADIGLVRTRRHGAALSDLTGAGEFNHAIVVAKEGDHRRFLDPTGTYYQKDNLPTSNHGADVLIVKEKGLEFTQIPWPDSEKNGMTVDVEFDMDEEFNVTGTMNLEFIGMTDGNVKQRLAELKDSALSNYIQKMLSRLYPNARFDQCEIFNQTKLTKNARMEITFKLKNMLIKAGDQYVVKLIGDGTIVPEYIIEDREHPVYQDSLGFLKTTVTLNLPKSLRVVEVPENSLLDSELLLFKTKFVKETHSVRLEDYIIDKKIIISKKEYPQFMKEYEDYADGIRQAILIAPVDQESK